MSLRFNYLIHATDPEWDFSSDQITTILASLKSHHGQDYQYWLGDKITFLDCGEGFDSVRCNLCQREIDTEVWGNAMQIAFSRRFEKLDCLTPCCKGPTSLNRLIYRGDQGFARNYFVYQEDSDRDIGTLDPSQVQALSEQVEIPLKFIHAYYMDTLRT